MIVGLTRFDDTVYPFLIRGHKQGAGSSTWASRTRWCTSAAGETGRIVPFIRASRFWVRGSNTIHCGRELLDGITGSREATGRLRVCAIGDSMWNDIKGAANEVRASRHTYTHTEDTPPVPWFILYIYIINTNPSHTYTNQFATAQGYGSIFIADGIHAEALGLAQAGGQPVARAALDAFLKVGGWVGVGVCCCLGLDG